MIDTEMIKNTRKFTLSTVKSKNVSTCSTAIVYGMIDVRLVTPCEENTQVLGDRHQHRLSQLQSLSSVGSCCRGRRHPVHDGNGYGCMFSQIAMAGLLD